MKCCIHQKQYVFPIILHFRKFGSSAPRDLVYSQLRQLCLQFVQLLHKLIFSFRPELVGFQLTLKHNHVIYLVGLIRISYHGLLSPLATLEKKFRHATNRQLLVGGVSTEARTRKWPAAGRGPYWASSY